MTTAIKSSKYIALSFRNSSEDKILAALTSDRTVIIWEWDKSRATQATEINQIQQKTIVDFNIMFFYPGDDSLVLIGETIHKNHFMK